MTNGSSGRLDLALRLAPLIVSIAALSLSGYSFFKTSLEIREGLVAIPIVFESPTFADPANDDEYKKQVTNNLVFQNTGNRSVVIVDMAVWLAFRPPGDKRMEKEMCVRRSSPAPNSGMNGYGASTEQLPLILGPGQSAYLKATHAIRFGWDEAFMNGTIPICLDLIVLDSKGRKHDLRFPYGRWDIWPENDAAHGTGGGASEDQIWVLGRPG